MSYKTIEYTVYDDKIMPNTLQAGGAAGKIEPSGPCFYDNERPETGTFFFAVRGGSDGIFQPAVCVPVFGA